MTSEGRKLMVRCCQGAMVFSKDVNLPEEIDASLISSLLSKDGKEIKKSGSRSLIESLIMIDS